MILLPADTPSGPAGMVLAVEFTLAGSKFSGLNGGPQFPFTEAVSFQIACEDGQSGGSASPGSQLCTYRLKRPDRATVARP